MLMHTVEGLCSLIARPLQLFLYMIPYIGGDKLFVEILVEFAEIFAD